MFQQSAYPAAPPAKKQAGPSEYDLALSRGMQLLTSAAGLDAEPEDDKAQQQAMQTTLSSNVSPAHFY